MSDSIGSSGWVGGAKKHEIYVAAFGGHLFYDLFLQGLGGGDMAPSAPPWICYYTNFCFIISKKFVVCEEPVPRTKEISHCAVEFETGEENRIVYERLYWWITLCKRPTRKRLKERLIARPQKFRHTNTLAYLQDKCSILVNKQVIPENHLPRWRQAVHYWG